MLSIVNNNISILGCGWLGRPLALSLVANGYRVFGSTRSLATAEGLDGITHFVVDIGESGQDYSAFLASDVLIIAIPSKDIEGFKRLIQQIEASELRKVILISSTSVYPFTNGVVTEDTETKASPLAEIEQLFRESPSVETTIIRFGGLFGDDRKPGNFFRSGKPIPNPEGYVNMIHRDDCIRIMEEILRQNLWAETLNACADDHPTRRAFYTQEAAKLGRTDLRFQEPSANDYKIVSSEKLKQLLGYAFIHADLLGDREA